MGIGGGIRFNINGLNIEKLLNRLYGMGLPLYNVSRTQYKNLCFTVPSSCGKKVIAVLDKLCYNYTKAEQKGIFTLIKSALKRAGLIAGAALFALGAFASAFFLYEIRIYGCDRVDPLSVLKSVNEAGAEEKTFFRADSAKVERAIYSNFSLVAFVSAQYKGVVLYIKIVETENPPDVIDSTPKDLTASHRGKISKLLVYQGTPLVKAGDTVEKGQVIIGGYRESPDGSRIPVRAMGEAYGVVELVYTEVFERVKSIECRSGRSITEKHIEFAGMKFPISSADVYPSCDTEINSSYIFKNNFLPARLITVTYYEKVRVTVTQDFEKVKKIITEEAEKKAATKAQKEGRITETITAVKDEGDIKYIITKVYVEKSFF